MLSENRVDARAHRGELPFHHAPHQVEVDAEVVVDELVAHAGDASPGYVGWALVRGGDSRLTASPMISKFRNTASWVLRSAMNAPRPATVYAAIASIASRTWRR